MKIHLTFVFAWYFLYCVQSSRAEVLANDEALPAGVSLGVILDTLTEKYIPNKDASLEYWEQLGLKLSAYCKEPACEALQKYAADKFERKDLSMAGWNFTAEYPLTYIIHNRMMDHISDKDMRKAYFKDLELALKMSGTQPDLEELTKYAQLQASRDSYPMEKANPFGAILDILTEKYFPDKDARQLYWMTLGRSLSAVGSGPASESLQKYAADKFENNDLSMAGFNFTKVSPIEAIIHYSINDAIPNKEIQKSFWKDLELELKHFPIPKGSVVDTIFKYAQVQANGDGEGKLIKRELISAL